MAQPQWVSIAVGVRQVSGLLQVPSQARACYVLAHGADAALSVSLYGAGLEAARRAETSPATVRAAVTKAFQLVPRLALVAGGKSFGGRMTSQAQAESLLPEVRGLAFLGFSILRFPYKAVGLAPRHSRRRLKTCQVSFCSTS